MNATNNSDRKPDLQAESLTSNCLNIKQKLYCDIQCLFITNLLNKTGNILHVIY
jgi:hypothetical protein